MAIFQACLAVTVIVRIVFLRLRSVRWILFLLLCPVIVLPLAFSFPLRIDYRILWLAFEAFWWVCLISMIYALMMAVFSKTSGLPELLPYSRLVWTAALVASVATAIFQVRCPLSPVLDIAVDAAFVMQKAVSTVVALGFIFVVGLVLWSGLRVPGNIRIVIIGVGIILAVQMAHAFYSHISGGIGWKWLNGIRYMTWIGCLVYWGLHLSSPGETHGTYS